MKKKILFIIPSLRVGGAEKSLVNLLSVFDFDKYDVDLFLFRKDGLFLEQVSPDANIIGDTTDYEMFDGNAKEAVGYFLKKFKVKSAIDRYNYTKETDESRQWEYLRKQLPKITEVYDCAIAYLEGNASRFVADNISAKKKICYVHNDISRLGIDKEVNNHIFESCDYVVTVSEECKESLEKNYEKHKEKFFVIENIISKNLLEKMSNEFDAFDKNNTKKIVTVARCSLQKNLQLAVKTCRELKQRGLNIKWYQLGTGSDEKEIKELIKSLCLEEDFIMLGDRSNPYPYIAQCDIYAQTSLFEGKSISIEEAKLLNKPIVVTNYSTVKDQIENEVTGLISEMNEKDFADKIEILLNDTELKNSLVDNLKRSNKSNESEKNKLYKLIEN